MFNRGQEFVKNFKKVSKEIFNWGLIVFLLPQLFLFFYHFSFLFKRQANWFSFVGALAKYGLSISWVSLPIFTIFYAGFRCCLNRRIPALAIWGISFVLGGIWIGVWNWLIFPTFGFWRSIVPLLLCSGLACLYAVACHLYRVGAVIEEPYDYHEHVETPKEKQEEKASVAEEEGDHGNEE